MPAQGQLVLQNKYSITTFVVLPMIFLRKSNFYNHILNKTLLLLIACGAVTYSSAQTNTEVFGQNRVQYKDFPFQYYESDNFITYFYPGGQDVAKYVIKEAEEASDEISAVLDYKYRRKIDVIVYNNINELNQTNIGIYEPGQAAGGTVNIPDNKIFVYFNGDHRNLDKQIRESLAKIYTTNLFRGSNFGQVIRSTVLLSLPDWYRLGLVEYLGEDWSSEMEDRLRDGMITGRYRQLNKLQPEEAIFVGHSIWHYLEEVHGKTAVSNIIYLTRVNRSVDNGFLFVLGTNLTETLQNWYTYYNTRFNAEKSMTTMPSDNTIVKARIKKDNDYYQLCLSPDGKHVAYADNDLGRYKVYITNTETNKTKVVFRGGYRTNTQFTDKSIPLLAWDPSGKRLAFINDRRTQTFIRFYDMETKKIEVNPVRKFQKVISFSFVDSKQLVMSAVQNGQSDIYLYTIASTTTQKITDDYFDDLNPAYISADSVRGIMFSSNRPDDTLKAGRYESQSLLPTQDLFFYNLNNGALYRVTSTPFANETYPQNFNDSMFCYLSDETGIRNRYVGHFESTFDHNETTYYYTDNESGDADSISVPTGILANSALDLSTVTVTGSSVRPVFKITGVTTSFTNYTRDIREQSTVPAKNLTLDYAFIDNKPRFYKYNLTTGAGNAPVTEYMVNKQRKELSQSANGTKPKAMVDTVAEANPLSKYDSIQANRGNRPFDFQSEFDYGIKLYDWDSASAAKIDAAQEGYVFRFSRVRPYFVKFMVDQVVTQLDNDPIITPYQIFTGNYFTTPLPALGFKFGITDLLENHKIYGGVRLPFYKGFQNMEFFLTYENLTKRLDKKFTFYRGSKSDNVALIDPATAQLLSNTDYSVKTTYLDVDLKYALDVLSSLRFKIAYRNDKLAVKAVDAVSLNFPPKSTNWVSLRAEYVFDNCIEKATNIRYGTRFKVFGEFFKEFPTKNKSLSSEIEYPLLQFNKVYMVVIGADLRHYLKVYKNIIWANRIAGGASFGTNRLIYYMGGLDNWISPTGFQKFNTTTPINYNHNYAFQTIATPVRGFLQNARNGDRYIVLNSELRIPLFATLIHTPIRSEIIRNFQVIGFFDAGTAWEGASPFSNNNPLFNEEIPNTTTGTPSVIVSVKRYRTPVIFGFGPGLRTSFLGYFMRFDTAWGYDTGEISKKPVYYFTFGLDF